MAHSFIVNIDSMSSVSVTVGTGTGDVVMVKANQLPALMVLVF